MRRETASSRRWTRSDELLSALEQLGREVGGGLGDSIHALENTTREIRAQLETIRTHRQAMAQELEALKEYIADVARLIAAGEFRQALQLPFPSLDPVGHFSAIVGALREIPGLGAQMPELWSGIYDRAAQRADRTG